MEFSSWIYDLGNQKARQFLLDYSHTVIWQELLPHIVQVDSKVSIMDDVSDILHDVESTFVSPRSLLRALYDK